MFEKSPSLVQFSYAAPPPFLPLSAKIMLAKSHSPLPSTSQVGEITKTNSKKKDQTLMLP